jgi:hypothetical protein
MLTLLAVPLCVAALATPAAAQIGQPGVPSPETARAQGQTGPATTPTVADVADLRVSQLVIFEGDTCPKSNDPREIVVCAVLPGQERFRIPENLRTDPNAPENQSWTNKAIALSYVGATGTGSCSTVGPGGFTGCNQQLINQAVAERRGRSGSRASTPRRPRQRREPAAIAGSGSSGSSRASSARRAPSW